MRTQEECEMERRGLLFPWMMPPYMWILSRAALDDLVPVEGEGCFPEDEIHSAQITEVSPPVSQE